MGLLREGHHVRSVNASLTLWSSRSSPVLTLPAIPSAVDPPPRERAWQAPARSLQGQGPSETTLGIGGRRVLVSRNWSGKTLADHRADAHAWVKALLGVSDTAGEAPPANSQVAAPAPIAWELALHGDADLPPLEHRLLRAISQRIQRRSQLIAARQRDGTDPPADVSATGTPSIAQREVAHG